LADSLTFVELSQNQTHASWHLGCAFASPNDCDRAVDASTLSFGVVVRGDLVRDISVQGRVVAALHPTLISPAQGVVTLRTKAGSVVRKGDVLAIVDSPELRSALEQSKAQLLSKMQRLGIVLERRPIRR